VSRPPAGKAGINPGYSLAAALAAFGGIAGETSAPLYGFLPPSLAQYTSFK
jgi:hypothetical protein